VISNYRKRFRGSFKLRLLLLEVTDNHYQFFIVYLVIILGRYVFLREIPNRLKSVPSSLREYSTDYLVGGIILYDRFKVLIEGL